MSAGTQTQNEIEHPTNFGEPESPPEITAALTVDTKRQLVSRISASSHFNKAPRLTELLHYISERSLSGSSGGLREQEIGAEVFGRAANYDTSQDNIVRVQFGHLRRKLERYFAAEGVTETLLLEIPKGSYVPHFYHRHQNEPSAQILRVVEPVSAFDEVAPAASLRARQRLLALAVAVLLLAVGCGWLWWQNRQLQKLTRSPLAEAPALRALWSQLLNASQPTDIVLADSMFSLFQDRLDRQFTLQEYLNGGFEANLPATLPPGEREELRDVISRRYTSMADVLLMNRMLRLTEHSGIQPAIHFARDFQVRNLKTHNVILLGSNRSTPWTKLFESRMNFRFVRQDQQPRVINTTPQPGEQPFYDRPDAGHGHAIIAFLPNLDRTGNVLSLQGDDQISTEAAGELVTNEESFAAFCQRLGHTAGRLPWFEVLLRTQKVGNTSSAFEIIAIRKLN
jgi:hypothetical protein